MTSEGETLEPGAPAPKALADETVLDTAAEGLEPHPQASKRVLILGAGIAGLVAAYELRRQGHEPLVLEAQNRVGGRVHTLRDFAPGLYAEAGAMRIPRVHELTLRYCELFGLELRPFVMGNPKTLIQVGDVCVTAEEVARQPECLPFDLAEHERGRSWDELWSEATADVRKLYDEQGDTAWDAITKEYDKYSIREFLELRGFSEGAIELYGIMSFREQNMNAAVVEQLREVVGRSFEDMHEIVGGMDRLPDAFYRELRPYVRFGAEVVALEQDAQSVTARYVTRSGRFSATGDYAICTIPFAVLRKIEASPEFSPEKQKAIRQLNYNASTKILFQVRRRFWETELGIRGGTTTTDLPIQRIVYPSHSHPDDERGMLLASYTWGQDALRWGSMNSEARVEQALEDVAQIHPQIREEFEVGASYAWYDDPYAGGAFVLFEPEQQTLLQADIVKPEGRIHFAGEHCSLHHAWIQGALESGIRAAQDVHHAPEAARAGAELTRGR